MQVADAIKILYARVPQVKLPKAPAAGQLSLFGGDDTPTAPTKPPDPHEDLTGDYPDKSGRVYHWEHGVRVAKPEEPAAPQQPVQQHPSQEPVKEKDTGEAFRRLHERKIKVKSVSDALKSVIEPKETNEQLIEKMRAGDKDAANRLLEQNTGLAIAAANQATKNPDYAKDLTQEGLNVIWEAALSYDPSRGAKFVTHAGWQLKSVIPKKAAKLHKRGIVGSKGQHVQGGGSSGDDDPQMQLGEVAVDKSQPDRHKWPSLRGDERSELADLAGNEEFLDAPTLEHLDDLRTQQKKSMQRGQRDAEFEELSNNLHEALKHIPEREAEIVKMYFGIDGYHDLKGNSNKIAEIAGVSGARVRFIKDQARDRLKSILEKNAEKQLFSMQQNGYDYLKLLYTAGIRPLGSRPAVKHIQLKAPTEARGQGHLFSQLDDPDKPTPRMWGSTPKPDVHEGGGANPSRPPVPDVKPPENPEFEHQHPREHGKFAAKPGGADEQKAPEQAAQPQKKPEGYHAQIAEIHSTFQKLRPGLPSGTSLLVRHGDNYHAFGEDAQHMRSALGMPAGDFLELNHKQLTQHMPTLTQHGDVAVAGHDPQEQPLDNAAQAAKRNAQLAASQMGRKPEKPQAPATGPGAAVAGVLAGGSKGKKEQDEGHPADKDFKPEPLPTAPKPISAEKVLSHLAMSENQPKRDWNKFGSQWGISGDYHEVEIPMDKIKEMNKSGELRVAAAPAHAVDAVHKSRDYTPLIMGQQKGGKLTVLEGGHSLLAANRNKEASIRAYVPAHAVHHFSETQPEKLAVKPPVPVAKAVQAVHSPVKPASINQNSTDAELRAAHYGIADQLPTAEHGVTAFKTSQGSSYQVNGRSTQRTKTAHALHDQKDVGVKTPSDATVFVKPEDAQRIGMHMSIQGTKPRVAFIGGKLLLLSRNASGKVGKHGDPIDVHAAPQKGLAPVEFWKHNGSIHPGNEITEVTGGEKAPQQEHDPAARERHYKGANALKVRLMDADTDIKETVRQHLNASDHGEAFAKINEARDAGDVNTLKGLERILFPEHFKAEQPKTASQPQPAVPTQPAKQPTIPAAPPAPAKSAQKPAAQPAADKPAPTITPPPPAAQPKPAPSQQSPSPAPAAPAAPPAARQPVIAHGLNPADAAKHHKALKSNVAKHERIMAEMQKSIDSYKAIGTPDALASADLHSKLLNAQKKQHQNAVADLDAHVKHYQIASPQQRQKGISKKQVPDIGHLAEKYPELSQHLYKFTEHGNRKSRLALLGGTDRRGKVYKPAVTPEDAKLLESHSAAKIYNRGVDREMRMRQIASDYGLDHKELKSAVDKFHATHAADVAQHNTAVNHVRDWLWGGRSPDDVRKLVDEHNRKNPAYQIAGKTKQRVLATRTASPEAINAWEDAFGDLSVMKEEATDIPHDKLQHLGISAMNDDGSSNQSFAIGDVFDAMKEINHKNAPNKHHPDFVRGVAERLATGQGIDSDPNDMEHQQFEKYKDSWKNQWKEENPPAPAAENEEYGDYLKRLHDHDKNASLAFVKHVKEGGMNEAYEPSEHGDPTPYDDEVPFRRSPRDVIRYNRSVKSVLHELIGA